MARRLIPQSRLLVLFQVLLLVFGAVVNSATTVQAQDLAALARKERARRAKITKPTKVLTEDDGKAAAESGAGAITVMGTPTSEPAKPASPRPQGSLEAQENAWKARAASVRSALTTAEATLQRLEQELVATSADLGPLSAAEAQDPLRLQKKSQKIAELNKQITAQKAQLTQARNAVAAFEDEARSNGVPAGWLR